MRQQEQKAVRETKRARRDSQRRALHKEVTKPALVAVERFVLEDYGKKSVPLITPFDDMEEIWLI